MSELYENKFYEVNYRLKELDKYVLEKGITFGKINITFSFSNIENILVKLSKIQNYNDFKLSPLLLMISYVLFIELEKYKSDDGYTVELKDIIDDFCKPNITAYIYGKSDNILDNLKQDIYVYYFLICNYLS